MTARYQVTELYTASDGEQCLLSVDVVPGDGLQGTAERLGREYFQTFGHRVVESAKAAGYWPLPPDHPNAPRTDRLVWQQVP